MNEIIIDFFFSCINFYRVKKILPTTVPTRLPIIAPATKSETSEYDRDPKL